MKSSFYVIERRQHNKLKMCDIYGILLTQEKTSLLIIYVSQVPCLTITTSLSLSQYIS
jgi:hypothetical protein